MPLCEHQPGITARDYFAAHAEQPGVAEIISAAGLYSPDGHTVWSDPETQIGTFTKWWSTLTNERRFYLAAKVKFEQADAMLKARKE
jgi:hypothetical protein